MSEQYKEPLRHHAVIHPALLEARRDVARYDHWLWGRINQANDWLATHLGLVFGSVWVVWVFFIWPIVAQYMDALIQAKTSYYAQSWVQLFALPLFVYIGNKLQRSSDAQSETQHQALTHIAIVGDQNQELLQLTGRVLGQNTDLTEKVHQLLEQNTELTKQVHQLVGGTDDKE